MCIIILKFHRTLEKDMTEVEERLVSSCITLLVDVVAHTSLPLNSTMSPFPLKEVLQHHGHTFEK